MQLDLELMDFSEAGTVIRPIHKPLLTWFCFGTAKDGATVAIPIRDPANYGFDQFGDSLSSTMTRHSGHHAHAFFFSLAFDRYDDEPKLKLIALDRDFAVTMRDFFRSKNIGDPGGRDGHDVEIRRTMGSDYKYVYTLLDRGQTTFTQEEREYLKVQPVLGNLEDYLEYASDDEVMQMLGTTEPFKRGSDGHNERFDWLPYVMDHFTRDPDGWQE